MERFRNLILFVMLVGATFLPGMAIGASAQDASLCDLAIEAGVGANVQGYTVVESTGGSGSQIVLGHYNLSGGSGDDVLCALGGGGNILSGDSGNDLLIVMSGLGNEFYGGSGNDTMIGFAGDVFDGGSGNNQIIELPVTAPSIAVSFSPTSDVDYCLINVELSGFAPVTQYDVTVAIGFGGDTYHRKMTTETTDVDGHAFSQLTGSADNFGWSAQVSSNGITTEWQTIGC